MVPRVNMYSPRCYAGWNGSSRLSRTNWANRSRHTGRKGHHNIILFCIQTPLSFTSHRPCKCNRSISCFHSSLNFITVQGIEGPRGPPGPRGVPGEGFPGHKVGYNYGNNIYICHVNTVTLMYGLYVIMTVGWPRFTRRAGSSRRGRHWWARFKGNSLHPD